MDYVDTLQKVTIETINGRVECVGCSYNGVSFFVEEDEHSGGRNVSSTEIPYANTHKNSDQGGKVKNYTLNLYIVGENAEAARSELEEAFDAEGPCEFIHMYYGRFQARCTSYNFSHKSSELSYISGTATFVPEDDPKKISRVLEDVRGLAESKADGFLSSAAAAFQSAFKIAGKAASVVNAAVDATRDIMDKIDAVRNSMRDFEKFVLAVSQLRDNISTIMATPGDFANRIQDIFTMTKETFDASEDFNSYTNESLVMMDSIEVDDGNTTTATMRSQIQRLALISAASMVVKSVVNSSFDNAEQVHEMQEKIGFSFDSAMAKVSTVDDFMALGDLKAVSIKYLFDVESKLAIILDLPLNDIENVLTVCFDCYGTLDKVEDVIARNAITDPSAINRKSLKVLSK